MENKNFVEITKEEVPVVAKALAELMIERGHVEIHKPSTPKSTLPLIIDAQKKVLESYLRQGGVIYKDTQSGDYLWKSGHNVVPIIDEEPGKVYISM